MIASSNNYGKYAAWLLVVLDNCVSVGYIESPQQRSLRVNYQDISYDASTDNFKIGIIFDTTEDCRKLRVEFISEQDIINNHFIDIPDAYTEPIAGHSNMSTIIVSTDDLNITDAENEVYFRVTAVDNDNHLCSDDSSNQTFYRILRRGKELYRSDPRLKGGVAS